MRFPHWLPLLAFVSVALLAPLTSAYGSGAQRNEATSVADWPLAKPTPIFPLGVFEDATITNSPAKFAALIDTLQARGLDSALFTNFFSDSQASMLDKADKRAFNVFVTPSGDFNRSWWPPTVPADAAQARAAALPVVRALSPHPSLKGYIVIDEPGLAAKDKARLMTQALRELDPTRHAAPVLIGVDRVQPIFEATTPGVMILDVYPFGYGNAPCDTKLTGFGYPMLDFVDYVRLVSANKPRATPLWLILQTHKFGTGGQYSLRAPAASEVRLEHWLAIGEGATGIFWFVYSSQQGWAGLVDNPALLAETSGLAKRIGPLRATLLDAHKAANYFMASGPGRPYISTLVSSNGARRYAVVVNRDCVRAQPVTIRAAAKGYALRDLESGQVRGLGTPIQLGPGDGKIFEMVSVTHLPLVRR